MRDRTQGRSWFRAFYPSLQEAYCLTLVEGVPAHELLRRAGAQHGPEVTGIGGVCDAAADLEDETGDEQMLVAAADLGNGWTLVVEPNGYLGVREESIEAWADTTLVSHFRNVNARTRFCWYTGGTARLNTEDTVPGAITAAVADFDPAPYPDKTELALALAGHLTGIRLTPELLEQALFTTGAVDEPWN